MQTDFIRVLLWASLFALGLMLWNAWQADYPVKTATQAAQPAMATQMIANASQEAASPTQQSEAAAIPQVSKQPIQVRTDVLSIDIDPVGGNLIDAQLLDYKQDQNSSQPVRLMSADPAHFYLAQSRLVSDTGKLQSITYQSKQKTYQLGDKDKELALTLTANNTDHLQIEKILHFKKGSYLVDVDYRIHNKSTKPFSGYLDEKLIRKKVSSSNKGFLHITPYIGAAYSTPSQPFEKLGFEDMTKENLNIEVKSGWIAMVQLYFLSAWIPDSAQTLHFYSQDLGNDVYAIGMQSMRFNLPPGGQYTTHAGLYVGPAKADILNNISPHLGLTVNYGWLWFISEWLFWLLKQINNFIGNWGWSIVALTALIKLAFYHLSAKSYRSMARMRQLQPQLEAIKQRYGEDKQKIMQETMALYKKEGVNPMGGCLPILVQIPVFIALYWVLLESVDLYQAPFILWIRDLSAPDPYYVLPVLMGLTMFIQQKLSPPPADPTQEKVMLLMPILFTALFLYFPAGLVLYWVVNNTLSILQQWYITQHYQAEKKPFKSK
jgi:YidC/Oxa1 family membrane protein insertase